MKYINDIREIVDEYSSLNQELLELERMTNVLKAKQSEIDKKLSLNRERELSLIDKIVDETGEKPDFYKIMIELNELA